MIADEIVCAARQRRGSSGYFSQKAAAMRTVETTWSRSAVNRSSWVFLPAAAAISPSIESIKGMGFQAVSASGAACTSGESPKGDCNRVKGFSARMAMGRRTTSRQRVSFFMLRNHCRSELKQSGLRSVG
ncbi:MAG TPA: hypothetical protein PKX00_19365 [Opitutaceae bacterium]|nr:hypothetical protein [Opitutaceae bacterium]